MATTSHRRLELALPSEIGVRRDPRTHGRWTSFETRTSPAMNRSRSAFELVASFVLALTPVAVAQTGTLDQVSPAPVGATGATFNTVSQLLWQMQVRAGLPGTLEGVALTVNGPAGGTLDARIRIGDGWNTGPVVFSGTLVKTTSVDHEEIFLDTTSANLQVPVGSTFVIELQGNTGNNWVDGSYVTPGAGPPLYPEPLFLGGPGCFTDCGWRIGFKTWVLGGVTSFCSGNGTSATPCPCGNAGVAGRGCDNSAATGGAQLWSSGPTSPDALILTTSGELATSLTIFFQGDAPIAGGVPFGDGVRCIGGSLKRIGLKTASGGSAVYPQPGDLSISARSAALGDPIAPGSTRWYQAYYSDPVPGFCPTPAGNSWNVSNGLQVVW